MGWPPNIRCSFPVPRNSVTWFLHYCLKHKAARYEPKLHFTDTSAVEPQLTFNCYSMSSSGIETFQ